MYERILIPTDGSAIARHAIKTGVSLAKALRATVVGYYAVQPIERIYYTQGAGIRAAQVKAVEAELRQTGEQYLEQIRKAAAAAGVACETVITSPAQPFQGIIDAARKQRCDAICMASHGRGMIGSALLGSVTQKVLTHSKIPVVVCR
jgi:nucleotide-binding universal stress UspA family protein